MIIRYDYNNNQFYNASDAAKFLQMARTTFLYFYNKKNPLNVEFKPKYRIFRGKKIWLITELELWKNKTSNIQFGYKKALKLELIPTDKSNVSKVSKLPIKSKTTAKLD